MLHRQISLWYMISVKDDPKKATSKLGPNQVSNCWDIADIEFLVGGWWVGGQWTRVFSCPTQLLGWVVVELGVWQKVKTTFKWSFFCLNECIKLKKWRKINIFKGWEFNLVISHRTALMWKQCTTQLSHDTNQHQVSSEFRTNNFLRIQFKTFTNFLSDSLSYSISLS